MNKMKVTIFLITVLNIIYVIYSKGLKPLFLNIVELVKLVYNEVIKPLSIYVYNTTSDFITYSKSNDFKSKIEDMKTILNHSVEYFKQNNFESIYNDITNIKNIVLIVIKHFYKEYKIYSKVEFVSINNDFTEIEYKVSEAGGEENATRRFSVITNEITIPSAENDNSYNQ